MFERGAYNVYHDLFKPLLLPFFYIEFFILSFNVPLKFPNMLWRDRTMCLLIDINRRSRKEVASLATTGIKETPQVCTVQQIIVDQTTLGRLRA
ncbi:MAG TPA: hypothetical protein VN638_02860 [Nitrospiraceae bacterium]|nr:hypothetical protein [Nitrospiraceae bacterium]